MKARIGILTVVTCWGIYLLLGCGAGPSGAPGTGTPTPPPSGTPTPSGTATPTPELRITAVDAEPDELPWHGGTVTITATVTGVSPAVVATIIAPNGAVTQVDLTRSTGDTFTGEYDVPGNQRTATVSYSISITATSGGETARATSAASIQVRGVETPPPQPGTW